MLTSYAPGEDVRLHRLLERNDGLPLLPDDAAHLASWHLDDHQRLLVRPLVVRFVLCASGALVKIEG
jgi:hypothetical protein